VIKRLQNYDTFVSSKELFNLVETSGSAYSLIQSPGLNRGLTNATLRSVNKITNNGIYQWRLGCTALPSLRDPETGTHVDQKIGRIHARRIPPIPVHYPNFVSWRIPGF
jgi:hypothetical protein